MWDPAQRSFPSRGRQAQRRPTPAAAPNLPLPASETQAWYRAGKLKQALCPAERSPPQQRRARTEEASTSSSNINSSALSTRTAEPKEAEVVLDEEQREEHYNPVMWCVPSPGLTDISR